MSLNLDALRIGGGRSRVVRMARDRSGLTSTGVILVSIAVVGWLLARFLGSRAVFLLVYGTIMLVGIAWVLGRRPVAIEAQRVGLHPRFSAGQTVEVRLDITARRRLSNVIVEDLLPPALGQPVHVPISDLPPKRTVRHAYRFVARRRGVYAVGPLMVTRSDPFGVTRRRSRIAGPSEIIIHPAIEAVHDRVATREWEDPPIRPPVSKPWPTGFEFYGMRDYASGDDPRRIVWRASARLVDPATGLVRHLVRQSEQGITDRVCLILDTSSSGHSPGDPSETFETAVRAVASLAVRHLRDGFAVTIETNGKRLFDGLRGERHRIALLDELARVEREAQPLSGVIDRLVSERRRRNFHTVVVTPDLEASAAVRLRPLADRASLLIAHVLWYDSDPASLRRAAGLGCNVVELESTTVLESAFRRVVGAGVRREH